MRKTIVLGASTNTLRYSNMAIKNLLLNNHHVIAVGKEKNAEVYNIPILNQIPLDIKVHTLTLYLSPKNQTQFFDDILKLNPIRIIFNPGTENNLLSDLAAKHKIKTLNACTLVLLSTGQYFI